MEEEEEEGKEGDEEGKGATVPEKDMKRKRTVAPLTTLGLWLVELLGRVVVTLDLGVIAATHAPGAFV